MKFSIKDFFSKSDQICRIQRVWSHFLKKSLMENFTFCIVTFQFNRFYDGSQLIHLWQIFPFYTCWKLQKTKGFLVFSRGIKRTHWPQMCWQTVFGSPQLSFSLAKSFSYSLELYLELTLRCFKTFCYLWYFMDTRVFKLIFTYSELFL